MDPAQQIVELRNAIVVLIVIGSAGMVAMNILAKQGDKPADRKPLVPTYYCRKHGCPESQCETKHTED